MLFRHHPRGHLVATPATGDARGPTHLGPTLAAASISIFIVQLDFFALNLALPRMASDLDTSTTGMQWAISGYMLALAAFLIPGGRLGDILGRKRMLVVGVVIFGLCSLGAGLAGSAEVVIAFRIVQGVGAGIIFPLAIAIITDAFPPERTMRAIGNAYGIGAVSMALGPVVGGGVTELLDWRWVLLLNVPVAVGAIGLVAFGVRESRDHTVPRSVDLPGLAAVSIGIAAVTFAVDRAEDWAPVATLGLALAGLLVLVLFVLRERVARLPLVDLALFRNAPYVVVTLMATVANVGFVVMTFSTTIYLQQAEGYTPLDAGLIFLAASLMCGVAGPLSGRLGERFDIPRTIAIATVVGALGLLILSLTADLGPFMVGLALGGLGYGIGWSMATVGTQTVVPPEEAGGASGVTLAIVIGLAGLAVAGVAALIDGSSAGLGPTIEAVLRWTAIISAALAAGLVVLAARVIGERVEASA